MEAHSAFVQVGDVRLHYLDWGDNGPPLFVLHGGRISTHSWDATARLLSKDFHVVTMDARGHGDSDKPPRGYSYGQRVEDMDAFLDVMKWDHPFGMAHSTGAMAMALHASTHPGRFTKLVLIEPPVRSFVPTPQAPTPPPGTAGRGMGLGRSASGRSPSEQRRAWPSKPEIETYLRKHPETGLWREDVMKDFLRGCIALHENASVEMKWSTDAYNPEDQAKNTQSLVEEAPKITVPVLLMYGTKGIGGEATYRPFFNALPQADLAIVEEAHHNIYMEDPDLVADVARDFLKASRPPAHEESRLPMHPGRLLANGKTA